MAARQAADAACTAAGRGCANATGHGDYVSCIARQAKAAVKAGTLPKQCKGPLVKCAARSTCGRSGFVTCCRTNKRGTTSCAIKHGAAKCVAPKAGSACAGSVPSCCDACAGGTCASASTTTTTTISSTTTTLPSDCTSVPGNLVQNCGFEAPAVGSGSFSFFGPGDSTMPGWTVATVPSGGVDLVNATFAGTYPVHAGTQSLDLNHSDPGGVVQDVPTTPGRSYELTFFVSGFPAGAAGCPASDPKTLTVTAGSASADYSFPPDTSANPAGSQPFVPHTLDFTGAGGSSTAVTFASTTTGCAGPVIDDVTVLPVP